MKRSLAFVTFLLITDAGMDGAQVQPAPPGSVSCPRRTGYVNSRGERDGCLAAPAGTPDNITLFQHPDFFSSYATQSGQTYKSRPPWNVAGVDYPVGIPKNVKLKDPATDPLPAGCSYRATGNTIGGPMLTCTKGPLVLNGYDMSGRMVHPGAHGCVDFVPTFTGSVITFKNDYFGINSACLGASNQGYSVQIFTGDNDLDMENCVWDYSPPNPIGFRPLSVGQGSLTLKYNAWINMTGDPIAGSAKGNLLVAYNYVDTFLFNVAQQGHGEFIGITGGGTQAQTYYFFNTILQGHAAQPGSTTTTIWLSNGVGGITYADAQVLNNTTVVNLGSSSGDRKVSEAALVNMNYVHTATQVRDNYFDHTGAYYVGIAASAVCTAPVAWSGNIYLVSGTEVAKGGGGNGSALTNDASKGC
jgi:hypothetical protein